MAGASLGCGKAYHVTALEGLCAGCEPGTPTNRALAAASLTPALPFGIGDSVAAHTSENLQRSHLAAVKPSQAVGDIVHRLPLPARIEPFSQAGATSGPHRQQSVDIHLAQVDDVPVSAPARVCACASATGSATGRNATLWRATQHLYRKMASAASACAAFISSSNFLATVDSLRAAPPSPAARLLS